MNNTYKLTYQKASSLFFKVVQFFDRNVWMSSRVSEALAFRAGWRTWINQPEGLIKAKLWIHGASVGELEDLAAFFLSDSALHRAGVLPSQVIVTASSASAKGRLEHWRATKPFLYCGPIPIDTSAEVSEFLTRFTPENLLLSHNDFWPNLFFKWHAQRQSHNFFWYLKPKNFAPSRLASFEAMRPIRLDRKVIGNLRLDRVLARIEDARRSNLHVLSDWQASPLPNKPSVLVGSCRIEDARVIASLDEKHFCNRQWVVMPHHSDNPGEVAQISQLLGSRAQVIATQGILLEAYRDFDLAWIGGGFSPSGSHNALEALAWGVSVICGPNTSSQLDTAVYAKSGALATMSDATAVDAFLASNKKLAVMKSSAIALARQLRQQDSGIDNLVKTLRDNITF